MVDSNSATLTELAEQFICERSTEARSILKKLSNRLSNEATPEEAATILRRVISPTLDYTTAQLCSKMRARCREAGNPPKKVTRIAILGSFTTKQLGSFIDLFLFAAGIEAEIYEADYGVFRQEIIDPQSGLYEFQPHFVYIATSARDLARNPNVGCSRDELLQIVADEEADWHSLWDLLQQRLSCQIIQDNFVQSPYRSFANYEARQPGSRGRYLSTLNQYFADNAPSSVTIHDVDSLAELWGRWNWSDPRFVHHAKLPCAPEMLVDYAHSVASLIAAQAGLAKKCLVLDLDNTLWGGVIGDDGIDGIRLGQGEAEGEAFVAFQQYIKSLQMRGIILAVCSKNTESTAREVFEKHREMVLKLADISCFVANWEDKASNLRTIAQTLNIGLNSLVFVDDNPAERAIVRRLVPEVAVPELPDDVVGYAQVLERRRYFQVLSIGTEDLSRTDLYRADSLRQSAASSATDMASYLRSLEMVATIEPIDTSTLERTVQLIQRSNQFNLTTRRRSPSEVLSILDDDGWLTRTVSLADRFGDNGLISVLIARREEQSLVVDTWLMSCRVLKRGVEHFLLNELGRAARSMGLSKIRGQFIPSSKNSLVRDHYAGLGFTCVDSTSDGQTTWELSVGDDWKELSHFVANAQDVLETSGR